MRKIITTSLFLLSILMAWNMRAQNYQCNGNDVLSGVDFVTGTTYYAPNWNESTNYTEAWNNGEFTLHLGDASSDLWQAQFSISCASQTLVSGKTYFLSFDIETNVNLPRVYMKLQAASNNNNFVDLPALSVAAGKQTVSGITVNTAASIDEILFDFGGNPANADITISNITLCDDYSGETPPPVTYVCDGNDVLSGVDFEMGTAYYAPNWNESTNYTEALNNGEFTLHLGDASSDLWQAQFSISYAPQTLVSGKTYFLSFDIETNVNLPRVYMKLQAASNNNNFVDLPALSVAAGKQTVSGITVNTAASIDEIVFDFGGNPANADITISNITVCDNYKVAGEIPIGSMIETGVALYPDDDTAPPVPGTATPVSGLSFDYKLVTIGSTTWAWTNVTGITLSHNSYSSQYRYWPTTGPRIENNLTNYPSGTQQSYGTASSAQPNNPVTITFFQEQNNVFYETSGYTYDNTIANSADASDKTAPVLTCDTTSTSGLNLQLNLAATDDSGNYFYYIVDTINGIQDVSFLDGSYQKTLSAGTDYDIKVYAIDFSGNESAPAEFKFSTPVIDYSEVPSEYCSTQFGAGSANGTAALMTMITDSDGNFYMMIAPDPTTGDASAAFRNLGYNDARAQAITVNGNPNTNWQYFTRTMSPDFSYIEFTPVAGMMKAGDKVYINQTLEYQTPSNTNAWPTIPFTYTYGTTCEGVEPPAPPEPLPAPMTPAPTPVIPAANVMSMFSSAYTTYNWFNPGTTWGSATQVSTVSIQTVPTWMFTNFDYQGFEFVGAGGTWNVSGMTNLHLDVWSPNLTDIQVNIGGASYTCTPLTANAWNSFDIPITALAGGTLDLDSVQIMKFTADGPSTAENLAYLDNVYFYTDRTSIPNISAGNAVVVGGQSSVSATFDGAATVAVYSVQGVLIKKTNVQSSFEIGNLPAGIYLVKINNSIYKAIVK